MKRDIRALITCIFILYLSVASAQTQTISGTVKHTETQEPVSSVTVTIKGTSESTFTDEKGNFRITTRQNLPVVLVFSSTEFDTKEVEVISAQEVSVTMTPTRTLIPEVVVRDWRISPHLLKSPVSIERIIARHIRNSAATSYYDILGQLKGVDLTTSGLLFKTVSTRGFNGSGSTRVNQIVDGMDNQTPGLNFPIGNFAGLTELDVESMELLPGASSALYGPGGMNGTVLINSKNPFQYQGLSVQLKQGIMHVDKRQRASASSFMDYSLRWAKAFNNKFAFKIGAQYISANDWLTNDSTNYRRLGNLGTIIPGNRQTDPNYDGVNVYGDETSVDLRNFLAAVLPPGHPLLKDPLQVSRTGYNEIDLIDPETRNIKISGALHYKLTNNLEAQLMGYTGTGNTVYTGNNRYVFKDIKIGQYKLELKHPQWFLRSYTTQEDAGEAYSTTITAQYMNEAWKRSFDPSNPSGSWYPQYTGAFLTALQQGASLQGAHNAARSFADQGRPLPGTLPFNQIFDQIRQIPIPNGGRFLEKSQLWMSEGQYNLANKIRFADVIVGANFKKYILDSDGTLFIDTIQPIKFNEWGAYAQISKALLNDKLTLSLSGRYDKNEDFKGQFTPRATALISVAKDNNIRLSYQTAYRFASTLQKYLRLDVGGYMLLGGLPWVMDFMETEKNPVFEVINGIPNPTPYLYKEFKPEKMSSFEVGYKSLISNQLLIDVYGYFGSYQNFIGRNVLLQKATGKIFVTAVNSSTKVKAHGYGIGFDYRLPYNFSAFANAYSDELTDVPEGFQVLFNTPKYRVNAGVSNTGFGPGKHFGFNVVWRWQDAFYWEGELANGRVKAFNTIDAQVNYRMPKIKSMIKIGGTNILNHYYKNGFGNPEIGGLYYVSLGMNVL